MFARKQCIFCSALCRKSYFTLLNVTSIQDSFCLETFALLGFILFFFFADLVVPVILTRDRHNRVIPDSLDGTLTAFDVKLDTSASSCLFLVLVAFFLSQGISQFSCDGNACKKPRDTLSNAMRK